MTLSQKQKSRNCMPFSCNSSFPQIICMIRHYTTSHGKENKSLDKDGLWITRHQDRQLYIKKLKYKKKNKKNRDHWRGTRDLYTWFLIWIIIYSSYCEARLRESGVRTCYATPAPLTFWSEKVVLPWATPQNARCTWRMHLNPVVVGDIVCLA